MIVKSLSPLDQIRGTAHLAAAARRTANGELLSRKDLARMLTWHCVSYESYRQVCLCLFGSYQQLNIAGVRAVGITPNLFALGLYPRGWATTENPERIVLLELDSSGTVLQAETWQPGSGPLSKIFDEHKDDVHDARWLDYVQAMWDFQPLSDTVGLGRITTEQLQQHLRVVPEAEFVAKPQRREFHARLKALAGNRALLILATGKPATPKPASTPTVRPAAPARKGSRRERQQLRQQIQASQS